MLDISKMTSRPVQFLQECVHKSGVGRGMWAFIYALSADETNPVFAAPRHTITALFSCCFKCPCPPGWQPHFRSNADRAYNTLHFASKVVCQRGTLWKSYFVGVYSHTSSKMQISGIDQPIPSADLCRLFAYMGVLLYRPYQPFYFVTTICKVISGMIAGSQLSDTALAIASIFLNTSSLSKPTTSLVLSAIPKMIFPPVPFAKATTYFIYLMLFSGRFSLNSTFFDSPARISSMVIVTPRFLLQL